MILAILEQSGFNIHTNSTSAFIQNSKDRAMVEESTESYSLLFTSWQHIIPLINSPKAPFSFDQIAEVYQP